MHCGTIKIAPFLFYNNFVKPSFILVILTCWYLHEFATKQHWIAHFSWLVSVKCNENRSVHNRSRVSIDVLYMARDNHHHSPRTTSKLDNFAFLNSSTVPTVKVKGKGTKFCIALLRDISSRKRSGITQFLHTVNTPYLPLPRKRSPCGATTSSNNSHLITTYYSFNYRPREDERPSWPS